MLQITEIGYKASERMLLQEVSFEVPTGALTAVMGANGAGKSTLLKILSGDLKAAHGTVTWNGKQLQEYKLDDISKRRSVLRQQYHIQLPFTVSDIVEMGRFPHGKGKLDAQSRLIIAEVAEYVGISGMMERNYLTLSGGEQQRAQLARVLVQVWDAPQGEKLIMLDEPVSALDIHYQHQLLALVEALTERGFTVLAVLHDLNLAMQYAHRVLLLKQGKTIAYGPTLEVMTKANIKETFNVEVGLHHHSDADYPFVTVKHQSIFIQSEQNNHYVNSDHFIEGKI